MIARVVGSAIQYYHFDDLGSTLFLTDGTGTLTDKYAYDAWGNVTHDGPTSQPYQYVGQLGYYTHTQDVNMGGLLQLGVRFYEPEVGRFTQKDPLKYGMNQYCYGHNNSLRYVDPLGLYGIYDWMRHYLFDHGEPIDLAKVGLLETFMYSRDVQLWRGTFNVRLDRVAKSVAKTVCKCKKGKQTTQFGDSMMRLHIDSTKQQGLFVLGDGYINAYGKCKLTVDCTTGIYKFKCKKHFTYNDWFRDVPDIGDWREGYQELPSGIPFPIYASWDEDYSGSGHIH